MLSTHQTKLLTFQRQQLGRGHFRQESAFGRASALASALALSVGCLQLSSGSWVRGAAMNSVGPSVTICCKHARLQTTWRWAWFYAWYWRLTPAEQWAVDTSLGVYGLFNDIPKEPNFNADTFHQR